MWDESPSLVGPVLWLVACTVVAAAIACLNNARLRTPLIWAWALLPVWLLSISMLVTSGVGGILFGLMVSLWIGPFWGAAAALGYGLVRGIKALRAARAARSTNRPFE